MSDELTKTAGAKRQIYNRATPDAYQLTNSKFCSTMTTEWKCLTVRRGSLKGYGNRVNRVVKIPGARMEHFIYGTPETTFEQALRDNWPFKDRDIKSKWKIVTDKGVDVTKSALSSHEGTVMVEFLP